VGIIASTHYTSWEPLITDILSCTRCRLHLSRRKAVPGSGRRDTEILFIGEAPGATEDEMGLPFVGAAGKLLDSVLEEIGIRRNEIYITNVVKCRPPNNRQPERDEIEACSIYLESQILLIRPKIIVTLGAIAGEWVCRRMEIRWLGVTKMRGHIYRGKLLGLEVTFIPTYHPAAILRNRGNLEDLKRDLRTAIDELSRIKNVEKEKVTRPLSSKTLLDYINTTQSRKAETHST
jgi:DNA polymerase